MVGIYRIENTVNGKTYYGQTVDYEKRRKEHITALNGGYHHNRYLQHSWLKYGENAFAFSFVESCPVEKLNELETRYIAEKRTFAPYGYNLTVGGDGLKGWKPTPQQLAEYSKRSKKMWANESYREKMRIAHTGHTASADTRAKMSASHMGKQPPFTRSVVCVETGEVYPAIRKVVLEGINVTPSHISRACIRGTRAYGYHWKYVDDP